MANPLVNAAGIVQRFISSTPVIPDQSNNPFRMNEHAEAIQSNLFNGMQQAALEGSFYSWAVEGTRNTGVAFSSATTTAYAAASAMAIVVNRNPPGGPTLVLDSLKLAYDAVNTGGVGGFIYHAVDNAERYASGGTVATGYNAYGAQPPGIFVYFGNVTAAAATASSRDVDKTVYINGVGAATPILNIRMVYSCQEKPTSSIAIPATAGVDATFYVNPIVLPPGSSYVANEFQTSRSAAGTGEMFLTGILR